MTGVAAAIPTMRYRDSRRMIGWLGEAFGFAPHLVVDAADGGVAHAQLTLGAAMIMLGDGGNHDGFDVHQAPADPAAPVCQSPYLIVADVDAIHATAKAAGATMVVDLHDPDYGGRAFSCRDPEGQLWNFGSYDPWKDAS